MNAVMVGMNSCTDVRQQAAKGPKRSTEGFSDGHDLLGTVALLRLSFIVQGQMTSFTPGVYFFQQKSSSARHHATLRVFQGPEVSRGTNENAK